MKREFFFQDDRSNKFWTVEVKGASCITTNGRVGSKPRETVQSFASEAEARKAFEQQIAAKLRKGYVEGQPHETPEWGAMAMSDEVFWRILKLLDWKKLGDDEAVIRPAVQALAAMTADDIRTFQDVLAEKLSALDTESHYRHMGGEDYAPGFNPSADGFLYGRCVVVANGQALYERVLAHPDRMPREVEFEAVLWIAPLAYERKTGEPFDHETPTDIESFSNRHGWPVE